MLLTNSEREFLGAIVMDTLDLLVDCITQTLIPRDPDRIIEVALQRIADGPEAMAQV